MKIGVIIDSFRKDFLSSIKEAKEIGADGVQIGARFLTNKKDELAGNPVSESRAVSVKEAKKMLSDVGIAVSAVCGDFGCDMYYTKNRDYIDLEKRLLDMAFELGTNIVTTHIGVVPERRIACSTRACTRYATSLPSTQIPWAVTSLLKRVPKRLTFLKNSLTISVLRALR